MNFKKLSAMFLCIAILFSLSSCSEIIRPGKEYRETKEVELQEAEKADINLRMGAGKLSIDGSTKNINHL
ncbi:hypothetical protein [Fonticella tunisiensis]|uniref:Uncharacterized protein n=1 Tax=Fonticella tunisiensis TaxID=1096341 RepID=A0A4R7KC20_9CLOT|nr:hypothetical protein [Fonticella tunisiensis]TDT52036.1 hypothetical protein EDD71_11416 [Fonticella tunisiensis]